MPRTADYTIQGFLYQFNKTALEILRAQDDHTITVEGIVEDVEVGSPGSLTAIQCKYHETKTIFNASTAYKPLLHMLKHFSENPNANIRYVLFVYFSGDIANAPTVDKSTFQAALNSKDKALKKQIQAIPSSIDLDGFQNKFTIEFGPSYDDITNQVGKELVANGIPVGDIETLAYPNAIHMIAMLSIKHDLTNRRITKKRFLSDLKAIRATAISRWTLALRTRDKLLKARRKQLKSHLDINSRLRYFVINPSSIDDYDAEIVIFISDYVDKYHFKAAHTDTPILCLVAALDHIQEIQHRLYAKGIRTASGYVGAQFEESDFFREPMSSKATGGKLKRDFVLRILSWHDHGKLLNKKKCADLFIIGEQDCDSLDTVDVNVERLSGVTIKEIKYIMGISNVYE
jgi:hypothetical protein